MSQHTSRCIIVLGTGRSGTSAVAGVLHHLGCFMGEKFHPADRNNEFGTFEDVEFLYRDQAFLNGKISKLDYAPVVAKREGEHKLWGAKTPTFARTLRDLLPILDDVRIVHVQRDPADTINSYMRAYYSGRVAAEEWYEDAVRAVAARLMEFDGPVLAIQFEDLLEDPKPIVEKIMHFAFDDMELPSNQIFNAAVKHIKSKPKRDIQGWGNIAIGVRVGKHPEFLFFNSWTGLLTGGVRSGDTVLEPAGYMAAHTAANKLARRFLGTTQKQTLLLVDDDMQFDMNALHKLRENKSNWEYDIVAPFCTHRTWPPKPIVMKDNGKIPNPKALNGQSFTLKSNIEKNVVEEVDAVGLAFTLIRREVLEAMLDEEYGLDYTFFFQYGPGWESDDIPFCRKAKQLGYRIAVDSNVRIGHIGPRAYGWDDFKKWREEMSPLEKAHAAQGDSESKGVLDLNSETLKPILEVAAKSGDKIGRDAQEILQVIREKEHKGDV